MKNLFALLTLISAGFVAAPDADARPHRQCVQPTYVSHHTSCGCPVYQQRYIAYYDRCGHPVYRVRTLPVRHRCRPVHHRQYRPRIVHPRHGRYTSSGLRIGPVIVGGGSRGCR